MVKRILVVEDELAVRDVLEKALSRAGYRVFPAASAEDALEILCYESIMVMLLDLNLGGMDGLDLCKTIRLENPVGIIYALTGYTDLFGFLACRKAGFDDFFIKPVSLEVLFQAAKDAFDRLARWNVAGYELT
jgi:DNA-binding response OmpR family regulator